MQQRKIISKQIEFKAYKIAKIRQIDWLYGTMFCSSGLWAIHKKSWEDLIQPAF
jgi:hypothetical protein